MRPGPNSASAAHDLSVCIDRFEEAWRQGTPPDLRAALRAACEAAGGSDAARGEWLYELVGVDLEMRWRAALGSVSSGAGSGPELPGRPRLEDYLRALPELGELSELPPALIAAEYRVRHRWGDRPGQGEYRARFPRAGASLVDLLSEVDAELANEPVGRAGDRSGSTDSAASRAMDDTQAHRRDLQAAEMPSHPSAAGPAIPGPSASDSPPARLGRYEVRRLLGRGAFGEVYEALDPDFNRRVAIKIARLDSPLELSPAEGKALAALRHPGIVAVFDTGVAEDGRRYLVFEFVEGQSLAERIERGPLTWQEAAALVAQIAAALHHAHQQELVHRDIKPANILLDREGRPRVADFGLALHDAERWEKLGEASGTPAYMSPEQIRGETTQIDGRCDISALGVVLYELVTGKRPFQGRNVVELAQEIHDRDPKPLSMHRDGLPPRLDVIVRKCLAKNVGERYASAQELASELETLTSPRAADNHFLQQPKVLALLAFAAALLAVVLWSVFSGSGLPPQPPPSTAKTLPPEIGNLPAGPVLETILADEPPPARSAGRPALRLSLDARRAGAGEFRLLEDGAALVSEDDQYVILAQPRTDGWLYVFQVDSRGQVQWFFPKNAFELSSGANPVRAGELISLPPPRADGKSEAFFLDHNTGVEQIYAVFSPVAWPRLEEALVQSTKESAQIAAPAAPTTRGVETPFHLLAGDTRGVGGTTLADGVPPPKAEWHDTRQRLNAILPVVAQWRESSYSFVVEERWFVHAARDQ